MRTPNNQMIPSSGLPMRAFCGTDLELYDGTSNYLRRGLTEYPHHYGHEWVGVIETPPQTVHGTQLKPGAVVTGSTMIPCLTCDFCQCGRRNLCTNLREVGLYKHGGAGGAKACDASACVDRY